MDAQGAATLARGTAAVAGGFGDGSVAGCTSGAELCGAAFCAAARRVVAATASSRGVLGGVGGMGAGSEICGAVAAGGRVALVPPTTERNAGG